MLLVIDAFVLIVLVVASGATSAAEGELLNLAALLPGLFENAWQILHDLALVWAVGLLLLALLSHRRMRLFRDMLLAAAGAFAISAVAYRFVQHGWPPLLGELTRSGGPPRFPALRLAVTSAVVITASPHLARPLRYAGRWVVAGAAVAAVVLQVSSPGGVVSALVIGSLSAVIVHLIFGSPGGRPSLHQVAAALQELGVDASDLQAADLQPAGVWTVHGTGSVGEPLVIKVYGRDAWDSQLAMSVWRFVWYRNSMPTVSVHRIQQVEHEAVLILLAAGAGVAVPAVVAAGESAVGDALLVVRSDATPLDELADVDDALLAELWSSLDRAHETGISPGQLDPRRMGRDPQGRGVLLDWVAGETAPTPDQVLQDWRAALLGVDPPSSSATTGR